MIHIPDEVPNDAVVRADQWAALFEACRECYRWRPSTVIFAACQPYTSISASVSIGNAGVYIYFGTGAYSVTGTSARFIGAGVANVTGTGSSGWGTYGYCYRGNANNPPMLQPYTNTYSSSYLPYSTSQTCYFGAARQMASCTWYEGTWTDTEGY